MNNKPEKVWKTKAGYTAVCNIHPSIGHRCGYIGLPNDHPCFSMSYDSVYNHSDNIEAHGGLTYNSEIHDGIQDYPVRHDSVKMVFFGFDCGHLGDWTRYSRPEDNDTLRTLEFVVEECENLARQFKEIANTGLKNG